MNTPSIAFSPIAAGSLKLANRIVMAPMTRSRANGTLATEHTATYYAQRAGAGLIVTEGIQPSAIGQGYPFTPGLHADEQIAAWRTVTSAVHQAGGTIVAQLMHTGRIGHPSTTEAVGNGALTPVAPSPVQAAGQIFTPTGLRDYVVPDELSEEQIAQTIADFAIAARNAIDAGFDGVEVHGANGYLLHQFLATNANLRTDRWGGSADNRIRFTVEVTKAVAAAIGPDRTGIRLSPANGLGDTVEEDHAVVYPLLVRELDRLGLAYLHLVEAGDPSLTPVLRGLWSGTFILNAFGPDIADHSSRLGLVDDGTVDAVSFGRLFISNPDLVDRLANDAVLAEPDLGKAYGGDQTGYTDYPTLAGDSPADADNRAMQAYSLKSYGTGGLVLTDVPEPEVGPGQVKVRVEYIGVNPLDWKVRNGYLAETLPLSLPVVIGTDIAGTIVETGPGVDDLAPGDRVAGFADSGAYATLVVTRRERIAKVLDGLDLQTAASLVTSAETAQRVLGLLQPAPASTIVVNGAAGSVGSLITQLLVAEGHTVIGTAGSSNQEAVRDLGAISASYGEAMLDELRAAAPDGIDAAVDTAGNGFIDRVGGLIPAQRIVTIVDFAAGASGAIVAAGDPTQLTAATIGTVLDAAAAGTLTAAIDTVYAFNQLDKALARSESGHVSGKLIVSGPRET